MLAQERFNQRFVKDFNIPINIFNQEYFDYYRKTYDFFPNNEYEKLVEEIKNKYNNNYEEWNTVSAEKRDNIISSILKNPNYIAFNEFNMDEYSIPVKYESIPDYNIWTEQNHLKAFLSIDLKKANFQALKYHDENILFGCETYEELLDKFNMPEHFKKSKYLRQVIFGKLNPKRVTTIQRHMMCMIHDILMADEKSKSIINNNCKLVGIKTDELVYECNKYYWMSMTDDDLRYIEKIIKDCLDFDIRVDVFQVIDMNIYNTRGAKVSAFIKSHCFPTFKEDELKCVSTIFYPQVYKIWKRKTITEMDRVFFCEGQLATFNDNLIKRDIR